MSVGARGVGFTGETLKSAVTAVLGEDKLLYSALKGLVKQNMNAAVWTVGQTRLFSKEFPFFNLYTEKARRASSLYQPISRG